MYSASRALIQAVRRILRRDMAWAGEQILWGLATGLARGKFQLCVNFR